MSSNMYLSTIVRQRNYDYRQWSNKDYIILFIFFCITFTMGYLMLIHRSIFNI